MSLALLLIALFLISANTHTLGYLITFTTKSCRYVLLWHKEYKKIRDILHVFLFSLLPLFVICSCNISIVYKIIQSRLKRKGLQEKTRNDSAKYSSITYMLVTASICFIVFTLPESVLQLWQASNASVHMNAYYETILFLVLSRIVFFLEMHQ